MHARLVKFWNTVRASYWFFPTLMSLGAVVMATALTTIDARYGAEWLFERFDWLHLNQPDGARALLSTIAGSMITVAGVTFSITIAAVAFASSQFGPRILTNFMEDRGNQITLGTFIGTFLYCLLVLRTVRDAGETEAAAAFVPHFAILCAVVFAVNSVGVLIYFIHHIPESIHVSNLIARIGRELGHRLDVLFPEKIGEGDPPGEARMPPLPARFFAEAGRVTTRRPGYIHNLDGEGLFEAAQKHDLIVQVIARPGTFAVAGQPFLLAWPSDRLTEDVCRTLEGTSVQGSKRTAVQDLLFLVDELVEIAVRALSPGVNDPFTAMSCVDWLGAGLVAFAGRVVPDPGRFDDEGRLRVVAYPVTFAAFADALFDRLTPYAAPDRNASIHLMRSVGQWLLRLDAPVHRAVLRAKADALRAAALAHLTEPSDRAPLEEAYEAVERLTAPERPPMTIAADYAWLSGRA